MSKAEQRALEAYPSTSHYWNAEPDRNAEAREFYKQGYKQAEKDLELTWEDMRNIYDLAYNLRFSHKKQKEFFEEVLKRFKEKR